MDQATTCLPEGRLPALDAAERRPLAGIGRRICAARVGKADSQQHLMRLNPRP